MRSEVSGSWGLGSEPAVLKSGSGDSRFKMAANLDWPKGLEEEVLNEVNNKN